MREREDASRTREGGNRDEVEGVVANTLKLHRQGASLLAKAFGVGFIDWLDGCDPPARIILLVSLKEWAFLHGGPSLVCALHAILALFGCRL